ncbi:hypothetical protein JW948_08050 [bacterium]|nr:hypothetical protein [bacterium]
MKKPAIVSVAALLVLFSASGMAQTAKKAPEVKTVKAIEQSDTGKDNTQSKNMTDSQKTLANPEKSTYILESNLPTRSAAAVAVYDFTTGSDKYYGGEDGAKDLGDGKWGMVGGDSNGNGAVNATDYFSVRSGIGNTGYDDADCNMNGAVNATDYFMIKNNIGAQSPVD